ncbi:hypothetical protein BH11PSE11_BH11PSE11_14460 [soil metagenome]
MKFSRKIRLLAACIALAGMLFSQLALAAHACPAVFSTGSSGMSVPVAMSDCGHPIGKPSALCSVHCEDAKQSVSKADLSAVPPLVVAGIVLLMLSMSTPQGLRSVSSSHRLQRATDPPLSIRNCCFRI